MLLRRCGILVRNGSSYNTYGFRNCRNIVTSCRAVLLPRFGGPDVLDLRENVNVPDLKPNEVLVRARAVSINPLDTRVSSIFCLFSILCCNCICSKLSLRIKKRGIYWSTISLKWKTDEKLKLF